MANPSRTCSSHNESIDEIDELTGNDRSNMSWSRNYSNNQPGHYKPDDRNLYHIPVRITHRPASSSHGNQRSYSEKNRIRITTHQMHIDPSSHKKLLRFANVNARSVKNKTASIVDHVLGRKIDVCVITETWLKDKDTVSIAALSPPGYSFKSFPRQSNRLGGGTGVMFNNNFKVSLVDGGEKRSFEFSEWNFIGTNRTIKTVAVYRPPYSQAHPVSPSVFFEEFSTFLESIVMCSEVLLITGDFNFHLDDSSDGDAKKFIDLLETFGLIQHVMVPTHTSDHILDLLISRASNDINIRSVQTTFYISDHCFVECSLSIPRPNLTMKEIQFRKMKQINLEAFKTDITSSNLCNVPWSSLDDLVECYDVTLSRILEKHAPLQRRVVVVRPRVPWFNEELKHLKAKRRKLEKKMLKSKRRRDRDAYRSICNKYSAKLNNAKHKHYSELIDQCSGDSRKLFKVVSSLCKVRQEKPLPPHDDSCQLADEFGKYFCRKIELIKDDIDNITVNPPSVEYRSPEVKLETFALLSEKDVHDIITNSSNASCKLDPIPTWLLKLCANELTPVITKMINLSLQEGHVPDTWKVALLAPLLKKLGLDVVFENFRPVSNLSFVSKSTEKAVVSQLFKQCTDNAPLPANQSSYRQFYSTETALLKVQNDILMNMDQQEVTLLVLLDLSAAFDTIDHGIMLDILESDFGVVGNALKWIKSFLSGRKQRVHINQAFSTSFAVNCGVPQGSCLGPVLFLLYLSQLFQVVNKHLPSAHGYADDTQLYLSFRPESSTAQDQAVRAIEACIADVRAWLVSRKLMFNDSKTKFLIIGTRQQLAKIKIDSVRVGNVDIKPVESVRNLGSWFDSHMSMNVHVGKVCSKAFRGLYNIRQIRKFLSTESTKTLVHAFVTSHLDYCNSLLFGIPQYQFQRLQKVLNAAARVTCFTPRIAHITPVLMHLHWLPVKFRVDYKIALLVYKALHGLAPSYITELLSTKTTSRYQLRSDNQCLLLIPQTKAKTLGDRAFAHAAPSIWNSLPHHIRQSETINCFKSQLKTFLFKKAFDITF